MEKKNEIIKELNDFLKGINMGSEAFEGYEKKLHNPDLKSEFSKILSLFESQKKTIISFIEHFGGDPKDSLGIGGEIISMFEKFKEAFVDSDKEILEHAIKGINMGIQGGSHVLSSFHKIDADQSMISDLGDMIDEYKVLFDRLSELYNLM